MKVIVPLDENELKQAITEYLAKKQIKVTGEIWINSYPVTDLMDRPTGGHRISVTVEGEQE